MGTVCSIFDISAYGYLYILPEVKGALHPLLKQTLQYYNVKILHYTKKWKSGIRNVTS